MPKKNHSHQLVLPGVLSGILTFTPKKLALSKATSIVFFPLLKFFVLFFNVKSHVKLLRKEKSNWEIRIKMNKGICWSFQTLGQGARVPG